MQRTHISNIALAIVQQISILQHGNTLFEWLQHSIEASLKIESKPHNSQTFNVLLLLENNISLENTKFCGAKLLSQLQRCCSNLKMVNQAQKHESPANKMSHLQQPHSYQTSIHRSVWIARTQKVRRISWIALL